MDQHREFMNTTLSRIANSSSFVPGLIVVCGATATGKSGLAIALAQRLNTVILSADSRQVYRDFTIGTAKPSIPEQQDVPHYLIDICDPTEPLTVAEYQHQAQQLIQQCHQGCLPTSNLGKTIAQPCPWPLLVGGTGLYIRAVTRGLQMPRVPPQPDLRSQLEQLGQPQCYAMLAQVDAIAAAKIHPHDAVRTLRALEVYYVTGQPLSAQQGEHPPTYPILQIGLDCAEPSALGRRIAQRTEQMMAMGWVEEVRRLCDRYTPDLPLLNTLGYAELKHYLAGDWTRQRAIEQTILHTRQFAKRQRTWFRAIPEMVWFEADRPDLLDQVWHTIDLFQQSVSAKPS